MFQFFPTLFMVKIGSLIVKINKPNSDEDEFKQIEQPTSAMSNWNQSQNDDSSSEILPLLNDQAHFLPRKFGINETQQRVSVENLFDCIILMWSWKNSVPIFGNFHSLRSPPNILQYRPWSFFANVKTNFDEYEWVWWDITLATVPLKRLSFEWLITLFKDWVFYILTWRFFDLFHTFQNQHMVWTFKVKV